MKRAPILTRFSVSSIHMRRNKTKWNERQALKAYTSVVFIHERTLTSTDRERECSHNAPIEITKWCSNSVSVCACVRVFAICARICMCYCNANVFASSYNSNPFRFRFVCVSISVNVYLEMLLLWNRILQWYLYANQYILVWHSANCVYVCLYITIFVQFTRFIDVVDAAEAVTADKNQNYIFSKCISAICTVCKRQASN